ncbi:hypothetical protein CVS40_5168 [Lucilia cuprina]|nr:hypothetical protein CVS40_5168 [Lucilia cuprina]
MWKEISEFWGRRADCRHRWKLLRDWFGKELKWMEAPSGKIEISAAHAIFKIFSGASSELSMLSSESLLEPLTSSPTLASLLYESSGIFNEGPASKHKGRIPRRCHAGHLLAKIAEMQNIK